MKKWIVFYTEEGEQKCNLLGSKDDAAIVAQWYTVEGYENVEVIQCTPIKNLNVLRHIAMGKSPSVIRIAFGRK
tara:strand:- start:91 stop:312 length:222 start_codon:yes stop_codon:yes gene_type:complete